MDVVKPGSPTRRSARVNHEFIVGVTSEQGIVSGWGTNLSMGGVFVNASSAPPRGTKVSVLLQLPGLPECKLEGRVVRFQPAGPGVDDPGMAIEFVNPDEQTKKIVGQMVEKLTQDLARPA
ncbi:MAG TPA: TIGR02266 family protein [Myxococcales bacterium]|jgi:uncharacterized protein (TIGR02266 family)